jgi:N-methylhydantoinase B
VTLQPNDAVELRLPGGGGYGSPRARDPEAVVADVVEGYVSMEQAHALYGVVVRFVGRADALVRTRASYELDLPATSDLRRAGLENLTSG